MIRPVNDDDITAADESYARGYLAGLERAPNDDDRPTRRVPWWAVVLMVAVAVFVATFALWLSMMHARDGPAVGGVEQRQEQDTEQDVDQDVVVPEPEVESEPSPAPEPTVPAPDPPAVPSQPGPVRELDPVSPVESSGRVSAPDPEPAPAVTVEVPAPVEPKSEPPAPAVEDEPVVLEPEPEPEPTKQRPTPVRDLLCGLLRCG